MTSARHVVQAKAPGKINLFMRVGAAMPDGYHDVATAYQAVGLFEELRGRGYTEHELHRIGSGNVLRAMRDVESVATARGGS